MTTNWVSQESRAVAGRPMPAGWKDRVLRELAARKRPDTSQETT